MNPALVAVAVAIGVGAVIAVSARDARLVSLGLGVALVGAAVLADPLPETTGLAARVVAAILAVYLLWVAVRSGEWETGGSRLGPVAEASLAIAAAVVGFGTHGLGVAGVGPEAASAAGFALAALAVAPLLTGRDLIRLGVGIQLLMLGALLVRVGLAGTPTTLEELITAGLTVGLAGAVAVLATEASRDGPDGFDLSRESRGRPSRAPERRPARAESMPLWSPDAFPADASAADDEPR